VGGIVIVLPLTMIPPPFTGTEKVVPPTVIGAPPSVTVLPPMTTAPLGAVWIGWPASVGRGGRGATGRATVLLPTMTTPPPGSTEIPVPPNVAATPPAVMVLLPTTIPPPATVAMGLPATVGKVGAGATG